MKKLATMMMLSVVSVSQVSFANEAPMVDESVNFAFANASHLNVQALGEQEMKETEGAFAWLAPIVAGGALSSWLYHGMTYLKTGSLGTSRGAAIAAGAGALGGAYNGAMLSGAGIPTSTFAKAAWTGGNQYGNIVIRTNGAGIGQSWVGVHNRR